jgi:hypothetical protein
LRCNRKATGMQIISIKISELEDFVISDLYHKLSFYPITKHRAISQARNPRANPNDVALILAYNDEYELLGYIGALPDNVCINNQSLHFAWNSCWWVHPEKGKPAVMKLLAELYKVWDNSIFFSDLGVRAKEIIGLTGRYTLETYTGYRFFFRFYLTRLVTTKVPLLNNSVTIALLRFFDFLLNSVIPVIHFHKFNFETKKIRTEINSSLTAKADQYIRQFPTINFSLREKKDFDWVTNYPWILSGNLNESEYKGKYFFSHIASTFHSYFLEIYLGNELIGVLIFQERDGHYRLLYAFFKSEDISVIGESILQHLSQKKALSLVILHPSLSKYLNNKKGYLQKRVMVRYAAIPKIYGEILSQVMVQDGDGDALFC